jgi:hypothetical protein
MSNLAAGRKCLRGDETGDVSYQLEALLKLATRPSAGQLAGGYDLRMRITA